MKGLVTREPALFGIAVGALLTCGVQFGLPIDQAQANALTGALVALVTWWVRASVVSPATAIAIARTAAQKAVTLSAPEEVGAAGTFSAQSKATVDVAAAQALSEQQVPGAPEATEFR